MPTKKEKQTRERVVAKLETKARQADTAMVEYRREQEALAERTRELRELRLRHEARFGPRKTVAGARLARRASRES